MRQQTSEEKRNSGILCEGSKREIDKTMRQQTSEEKRNSGGNKEMQA